jgi:oligopeptide/dipeptide ABC transporter ATP-binding protein
MILEVEGLETHFIDRDRENRVRIARALNGVSFSVARGEVLGLVGETGAGKSLTAYSVLGLLRPPAVIVAGRVMFEGQDLSKASPDRMNAIRGRRIGLVVQSPRSSLDPLSRVGAQLVRVQRAHRDITAGAARQRALQILESVGIPDPARVAEALPHELSGGMAQRVLIALALVNEPDLLIADEPTTGLDVTVQAQVLELLRSLVITRGLATMLITHDLGVVAHYCDRVAVMYAGRIVELGPVAAVFGSPAHPYTRELVDSTPERLELGAQPPPSAPPPDLYDLPSGCHFQPRCPLRDVRCESLPPKRSAGIGHHVHCVRFGEPGSGIRR